MSFLSPSCFCVEHMPWCLPPSTLLTGCQDVTQWLLIRSFQGEVSPQTSVTPHVPAPHPTQFPRAVEQFAIMRPP